MWQQHQELLASPAGQRIRFAKLPLDSRDQVFQNLVAGHMPELIIDMFEMVDIEHEQPDFLAISAGFRNLSGYLIHQEVSVLCSGQHVGFGDFFKLLARYFRLPVCAILPYRIACNEQQDGRQWNVMPLPVCYDADIRCIDKTILDCQYDGYRQTKTAEQQQTFNPCGYFLALLAIILDLP